MNHSFRTIKADVREGRIASLLHLLESLTTAAELREIREQKLLFGIKNLADQARALDKYSQVAKCICPKLAEQEANYTALIRIVGEQQAEWTVRGQPSLAILRALSPDQILQIANKVADDLVHDVANTFAKSVEDHALTLKNDLGSATAVSEQLMHLRNGDYNDRMWSVARAFNHAIAGGSPRHPANPTRKILSASHAAFQNLVGIASRLNGLDYLIDKVSYGEWTIRQVEVGPPCKVVFDLADVLMERAKVIGIRRHLSSMFRPRKDRRFIQRVLFPFAKQAFLTAVAYYLRDTPKDEAIDNQEAKKIEAVLSVLGHEDEIILAATEADADILSGYLAAIALRMSLLAVEFVSKRAAKKQRSKLRNSAMPLSLLRQCLTQANIPESIASAAIERQIAPVPRDRYFDLIRVPFMRFNSPDVRTIRWLAFGDWVSPIRSTAICGGTRGKTFGDFWERECEQTFSEFGWSLLGRGCKIREGGRTITDVDALVFKEDLLLVVQFKATGVDAASVYDHWKARKIVEKGAWQAKLAADAIRARPGWLRHVLSSQRIKTTVTRIQPLVITTSKIFTGWPVLSIPIISYGYLVSLLRGAKVDYVDGSGEVVGMKSFGSSLVLPTAEFLSLLAEPLDWLIAENLAVTHRVIADHGLTLALPELQVVSSVTPTGSIYPSAAG